MNQTSPFSFLASLASRLQPPAWVVDEGQRRLVLFLNHVLMQEKQAQERLLRQKGHVVHARWGVFAIDLIVTPAGLVDRAPPSARPDLRLTVETESPLAVAQSVFAGKAPPVQIEGDVQLAAELGWLAENLRWDAEEDLSRLIGDAPAHTVANVGRRLLAGLKQFLARGPVAASTPTPTPTSTFTSTPASMPASASTPMTVPTPAVSYPAPAADAAPSRPAAASVAGNAGEAARTGGVENPADTSAGDAAPRAGA